MKSLLSLAMVVTLFFVFNSDTYVSAQDEERFDPTRFSLDFDATRLLGMLLKDHSGVCDKLILYDFITLSEAGDIDELHLFIHRKGEDKIVYSLVALLDERDDNDDQVRVTLSIKEEKVKNPPHYFQPYSYLYESQIEWGHINQDEHDALQDAEDWHEDYHLIEFLRVLMVNIDGLLELYEVGALKALSATKESLEDGFTEVYTFGGGMLVGGDMRVGRAALVITRRYYEHPEGASYQDRFEIVIEE